MSAKVWQFKHYCRAVRFIEGEKEPPQELVRDIIDLQGDQALPKIRHHARRLFGNLPLGELLGQVNDWLATVRNTDDWQPQDLPLAEVAAMLERAENTDGRAISPLPAIGIGRRLVAA